MPQECSSTERGAKARGVHGALMKYGMWACCAVMLLPVAGFLVAGGGIAGLGGKLLAFAPLALCLGMHVVMHKFMGKSCHSNAKDEVSGAPQMTTVPETRAALAVAEG